MSKKLLLYVLIICNILLIINCSENEDQPSGPSWTIVGTRGFSDGQASWTALDINTNGVPYAAYRDEANQGKLTVQRYYNDQWEPLGIKGFTADKVSHTCIDVYGGIVYAAYRDFSLSGKVSMLKYDAESEWSFVGAQGFTEESLPGYDPDDLSTDSYNNRRLAMHVINDSTIYIACVDADDNRGPYAYRYDGSVWNKISTGLASDRDTDDLCIHGLSSSAVYLAYSQNSHTGYYTKYSENNWSVPTPFTVQGGRSFSMKVKNDIVYIAYSAIDGGVDYSGSDSEAAPDKVYVKEIIFPDSSILGGDAVSLTTGTEVSLSFDSRDKPLVCYADWGGVYSPAIKKFSGSVWESIGNTSIIDSEAVYISFAVHNEIPYVAFSDADDAYGKKLTVMKYE